MSDYKNKPLVTQKPWGSEELIAHTSKYAGKLLHINAGESLSLQHHKIKEETIYVLSGTLLLNLGDTKEVALAKTAILVPGDRAHIQPGQVHRFSAANENVTLIEFSTSELDDVVRHEDRYGRK